MPCIRIGPNNISYDWPVDLTYAQHAGRRCVRTEPEYPR
jgi:hypothetical protein